MKIISIDNYDREHVSDVLICENVNEYYGKEIAEYLQAKFGGDCALRYYKMVADNYKLYEFKP